MKSQRTIIEITEKSQKLQQYVRFYNNLADQAYHNDIVELKNLAVEIYNGISCNYDGQNMEMYQLAGSLNSRIEVLYETMCTLLDKTRASIQQLKKEIDKLNAQLNNEN